MDLTQAEILQLRDSITPIVVAEARLGGVRPDQVVDDVVNVVLLRLAKVEQFERSPEHLARRTARLETRKACGNLRKYWKRHSSDADMDRLRCASVSSSPRASIDPLEMLIREEDLKRMRAELDALPDDLASAVRERFEIDGPRTRPAVDYRRAKRGLHKLRVRMVDR